MTQKIIYKTKWKPAVIGAIVCITGVELYALSQGVNGVLLTAVIGILAGLAGYNVPKRK